MKELITEEQAVFVITLIAWLTLPLGLFGGWLYGLRHKANQRLYVVYGLLIGLSGPFIFLMWKLYSGLVNHYGLDSVKGLLVELLIFVLIGVALGFILAHLVVYLKYVLGAKRRSAVGRRVAGRKPARKKAARRSPAKKKAGRRRK